jgi:hypothetical protein
VACSGSILAVTLRTNCPSTSTCGSANWSSAASRRRTRASWPSAASAMSSARAWRVWRSTCDEGDASCGGVPHRSRARYPLRTAHAAPGAGLHGGGRVDARARHRRQHRGVLPVQPAAPRAPAGIRTAPAGQSRVARTAVRTDVLRQHRHMRGGVQLSHVPRPGARPDGVHRYRRAPRRSCSLPSPSRPGWSPRIARPTSIPCAR